jgi:hypothetical protein
MRADNQNKPVSRNKFLLWGAGALAAVASAKFFFFPGPKKEKTSTVKMLTQDGRLVEVETDALTGKGTKASVEQVQNWVHKKSSAKI